MSLTLFLALTALILIGGVLAIWRLSRRDGRARAGSPAPGVATMGYGRERWERELALWRGIQRRLEIQARQQRPPSPRLQAELDEAAARIAEAERRLAD